MQKSWHNYLQKTATVMTITYTFICNLCRATDS